MCGFSGFSFNAQNCSQIEIEKRLKKMSSALAHRGPDYQAQEVLPEHGLAICHQRLSILDFTSNANQPMTSENNNWLICFNGEVYNYIELAGKLEPSFHELYKDFGDTRVVLEYISYFGIKKFLKDARGAFAFFLYNKNTRKIFLSRDRFGEKPLYFLNKNGQFAFTSDLRALKYAKDVTLEVDQSVLSEFLAFGYIHAPSSIFLDVTKVKPGTYLCFSNHGSNIILETETQYFNNQHYVYPSQGHDCQLEELDEAIRNSVILQTRADTNVGLYLSGGVDSSLIAYHLAHLSSKPIKTFTIKFNETEFDESEYAKAISVYLGGEHSEYIVGEREIINEFTDGKLIYDEPFSDSSALRILSKFVSKEIKCVLTGDGADELFGGYDGYWSVRKYHDLVMRWPKLSKFALENRKFFPNKLLNSFYSYWREFTGYGTSALPLEDRLECLERAISANGAEGFFMEMKRLSLNGDILLHERIRNSQKRTQFQKNKMSNSFISNILLHEQNDYLLNDILVKADRTSMYNSLEARAPFLDFDVFRCSQRFAPFELHDVHYAKKPLRKLLDSKFPSNLVERKKMGFNLPINVWLRHGMRDWSMDIVKSHLSKNYELFDKRSVENLLNLHQQGKYDFSVLIWRLLSFIDWHERFSE